MERITPPRGSIEETFKVDVDRLRRTGDERICSPYNELGCRLELGSRANPKLKFYFYRKTAQDLGPLFVSVDLSEGGTLHYHSLVRAVQVNLPYDRTKVGSWDMQGSSLTIRFTVAWGVEGHPHKAQPTISSALQESLSQSITRGFFLDTRFFAYSRRQYSGRVDLPRPIYANGTLLKEKVPYFETLLSNEGFSESSLSLFDHVIPEGDLFVDNYDYASDSDLEDELPHEVDVLEGSEEGEWRSKEARDVGGAADTVLVHSSDREDGFEVDRLGIAQHTAAGSAPSAHGSPGQTGRTVFVKDVAHKTFCALVHYLYTGNVEFARLTSEDLPSNDTASKIGNASQSPTCSPKSMYRLADKLGLEDLKRLAFEGIRAGLSEKNVVSEAFTKFTSLYDEIAKMEVDVLYKLRQRPDIKEQYTTIAQKIAEGELPHSAPILASIFVKIIANND
ncbi:hypothetical protein NEOLEDRAFT_1147079 [Neolentinus lepideus HHB14362 ss-1]|uniref:BTB domain-containing protein n=1 Tax=Neolentinus lepideus HHB14362 ss-1 TaxID=1314782 RepID=A0A165TKN0_9AGAM|nr:hypothetical protein NEOLEDRAFT_1147079 [Neolentinus lepideus HHB14362 ss-1]